MYGLRKALEEGVQDTTESDIARLTQRLNLLSMQINQRVNVLRSQVPSLSEAELENDPEVKALRERYEAVNSTLTKLESTIATGVLMPAGSDITTSSSGESGSESQGEQQVNSESANDEGEATVETD